LSGQWDWLLKTGTVVGKLGQIGALSWCTTINIKICTEYQVSSNPCVFLHGSLQLIYMVVYKNNRIRDSTLKPPVCIYFLFFLPYRKHEPVPYSIYTEKKLFSFISPISLFILYCDPTQYALSFKYDFDQHLKVSNYMLFISHCLYI
jgi:hypothetical protein